MRHYSDFFTVADDYCPVMTAAEINKTPDRWLDFYPHIEFEDICKTLLSVLGTGANWQVKRNARHTKAVYGRRVPREAMA